MNNLWQHFKDLFQQSEKSTPSNPFIHEVIERQPSEIAKYLLWKDSSAANYMTNWIYRQYGLYKSIPNEKNDAIIEKEWWNGKLFLE